MFDADYSAIEGRIVCWLAGQEDALQEYRDGIDRYVTMAAVIYGKTYEEIYALVNVKDKGAVHERFIAKQSVLGCGFQLGAKGFKRQLKDKYQVEVEFSLARSTVKAWRKRHPKVVSLWYDLERAAKSAIRSPGSTFIAGKLSFFTAEAAGMVCLFMKLPSGRRLCYPRPDIVKKRRPVEDPETGEPVLDEHDQPVWRESEGITYWGAPVTGVQWVRVDIYGGKFVENATQAVAVDIMANGAVNCERKGYHIAALIHDEALCYYDPATQTLEEFVRLLTTLPGWVEGLPIEAEGAVVPFYTK